MSSYADSSVLVSAIDPRDAHHVAARTWLDEKESVVTSVISEVEVRRALTRNGAAPAVRIHAERLVRWCEMVDIGVEIRRRASILQPQSLRSMDAIHIATASAAAVGEFASFDARQNFGAEEAGLTVARLEGR